LLVKNFFIYFFGSVVELQAVLRLRSYTYDSGFL